MNKTKTKTLLIEIRHQDRDQFTAHMIDEASDEELFVSPPLEFTRLTAWLVLSSWPSTVQTSAGAAAKKPEIVN